MLPEEAARLRACIPDDEERARELIKTIDQLQFASEPLRAKFTRVVCLCEEKWHIITKERVRHLLQPIFFLPYVLELEDAAIVEVITTGRGALHRAEHPPHMQTFDQAYKSLGLNRPTGHETLEALRAIWEAGGAMMESHAATAFFSRGAVHMRGVIETIQRQQREGRAAFDDMVVGEAREYALRMAGNFDAQEEEDGELTSQLAWLEG